MLAVVSAAAETIFVPLTIGGGIKDTIDPDGTPRSALEVAGAYFRSGADKVSSPSRRVVARRSSFLRFALLILLLAFLISFPSLKITFMNLFRPLNPLPSPSL